MKRKILNLFIISSFFLGACKSDVKEYQLSALNQTALEDGSVETTIKVSYTEDEVLLFEKKVIATSEDEAILDDFLQRGYTQQGSLTQVDGVDIEIKNNATSVTYYERIPFSKIDLEALIAVDSNFKVYIDKGEVRIKQIEKYLNDNNYSTSTEQIK